MTKLDKLSMGLMLSKHIIDKNGGKFDFNSEYNNGTTFVFSFEIEEVKKEDSP